jgi:hypothetical protein
MRETSPEARLTRIIAGGRDPPVKRRCRLVSGRETWTGLDQVSGPHPRFYRYSATEVRYDSSHPCFLDSLPMALCDIRHPTTSAVNHSTSQIGEPAGAGEIRSAA